ncbi:MAG: hypothetical protein HRT51_07245 [Colwellia sp.]|nr:hypothetical protein [Colwellia sp.]
MPTSLKLCMIATFYAFIYLFLLSQIWKASNSTVVKTPSLSLEYTNTPLGEWLSKNLPAMSFLGVKLWQLPYELLHQ